MVVDWRKLYAANQAEIARAGVGAGEGIRAPVMLAGGLSPSVPGVPGVLRAASVPGVPRAGRPRSASPMSPSGPRALVHVPRGLDAVKPAPLICMLHGCNQDPRSFAAATLMNDAADRHGFVVVYPGQDRGSNAQGCWNWFLPEHQRRGAGEPEAIASTVRDLIESDSRCTIDPARVFAAGLSSGGAMAVILAACYPDLFEGVAVHSGLAYGSATDMVSAFSVMSRGGGNGDSQSRAAHAAMGVHARPVASIVIHGSADRTVAPANAIEVLRQSMAANHLAALESCDYDVTRPTTSSRIEVDGGHSYTRSRWTNKRGVAIHELLEIDGLGHAWSGGAAGGSYTDPHGPSATEAICAFFALTAG